MLKIKLNAYKLKKSIRKMSVENIEHWINTSTNFKVMYFDKDTKLPVEVDDFEKGITYRGKTLNIVYIRSSLNTEQKIKTLVHEAGHILLDEEIPYLSDEQKEINVRKFTNLVFGPKRISYSLYWFFSQKVLCIAILLLLICINTTIYIAKKHNINIKNTIITTNADNNSVYITKNGDKYHEKDCFSIRDSNTMAININEAKKNYQKCKVCNPD